MEGIARACTELETPVTGGNVSFYNESPNRTVYPTPVIGMLGVTEDASKSLRAAFVKENDMIALIGAESDDLGGSEYLKVIHDTVGGKVPMVDYNYERHLHSFLRAAVASELLRSAHDVSEGGMAVALAECCIMDRERMLGAKIAMDFGTRRDFVLFGEGGGRVIISYDREKEEDVIMLAKSLHLPIEVIGVVSGDTLQINQTIAAGVKELSTVYYRILPSKFAVPLAV